MDWQGLRQEVTWLISEKHQAPVLTEIFYVLGRCRDQEVGRVAALLCALLEHTYSFRPGPTYLPKVPD